MRGAAWLALAAALVLVQGCASRGGDDKVDLEKAAALYADLGGRYLRQGEVERAEAKLERALELDDENADAHFYMAEVARRLGDPEKAEYHYRRAVRLDGENAGALNGFGAFLCERDRYEEAKEQFEKAAGLSSNRAPERAYENIALCALRAARNEPQGGKAYRLYLDEARRYFNEALKLDPEMARPLFRLARIAYREGEYRRAADYLKRLDAVFERRGTTPPAEVAELRKKVDEALARARESDLLSDTPSGL